MIIRLSTYSRLLSGRTTGGHDIIRKNLYRGIASPHHLLMACDALRRSTFILLFAGLFIHAQTHGAITGKVTDSKTDLPLYGVNLRVEGTLLGASSDAGGNFTITRLPPGLYTINVSMMGYERKIFQNIQVQIDQTQTLNVQLIPTVLKQPALLVTASKRKQRLSDIPTTVAVMQAQDILKRSPNTLDEVLTHNTGIGIIDGQLEMRGSTGFNWAAGSRVLLLLDGHPLINGDTGGINWDAIPVEVIERVEIVKGAGSALYGSNAMAGMVNIITRDPDPIPATSVRLTAGFYDEPAYPSWRWTDRFYTYRIRKSDHWNPKNTLSFEGFDITHNRRIGGVGLLMTVGRKRSNGYHQNGDYSRWNAMTKLIFRLSPSQTLVVNGNYAGNDHGEFLQWVSQSNPMVVPEEELGNRINYIKGSVHATYTQAVNKGFAYNIKSNWYRTDWKNNFPDNEDYAVTDKFGTEIQTDLLLGRHAWTLGAEWSLQTTTSRIFGNQASWDLAVYAEDQFRLAEKWSMTAGTRFDYNAIRNVTTDWQINPRAGFVFNPLEGTTFRLSAGRGFRAPSIAEVFANVNVAGVRVVPNTHLTKAETNRSTEIGLNQVLQFPEMLLTPQLILDAALFASWYDNMIDVDFNEAIQSFQFANMGRAKISGLEAGLQISLLNGLFTNQTGFTWLDPKDRDTGLPLPYRSNCRFVTGCELHLNPWTLGVDYRYAARQKEVVSLFENDERVPMHVLDARIRYRFGHYSVSLEGKNLRNYHYTLRQRLLEPIRHYVLTLRGNF